MAEFTDNIATRKEKEIDRLVDIEMEAIKITVIEIILAYKRLKEKEEK